MGCSCSKRTLNPNHPQLSDFSIIRSIGRGAFSKLSIVKYRRNGQRYALKYMNKKRCVLQMVTRNVLRELDLLTQVSHPFIVNLWFSFQDVEYMYMVTDLLLGGDLRYHLNQQGRFCEDRAKLYICEIALALEYLHNENIVHRDVKPENILLDDDGHAHLTDFNLATRLQPGVLATSFSGTRPYMAPEVILTALGRANGYNHRVDWFSLGVCFYEMLLGRRPYIYSSQTSSKEVLRLMSGERFVRPANWPSDLLDFISSVLRFDINARITSLEAFSRHSYMSRINMDNVLALKTVPGFVPRADSLNCDPTFELEERIVNSSTIYNTRRKSIKNEENLQKSIDQFSAAFYCYNRQLNRQIDKAKHS